MGEKDGASACLRDGDLIFGKVEAWEEQNLKFRHFFLHQSSDVPGDQMPKEGNIQVSEVEFSRFKPICRDLIKGHTKEAQTAAGSLKMNMCSGFNFNSAHPAAEISFSILHECDIGRRSSKQLLSLTLLPQMVARLEIKQLRSPSIKSESFMIYSRLEFKQIAACISDPFASALSRCLAFKN